MRVSHAVFRPVALCLIALLGAMPEQVEAQASRGCLWPAPQSECASWFITEAGLFARLSDRDPGDEHGLVAYSFGWMRNAGTGAAWGAELFGGVEGEIRGGVAVRVRRWLSPRAAVDFAAGVHLAGDASSQDVATGSPMVKVRVTYADKLAAVMRLDALKLRCTTDCSAPFVNNPNGRSTRFYVGVEVGSEPGLIAKLLTAAAVGIYALTY
jgi:hypothetical protein